jgi:hypothetical protein
MARLATFNSQIFGEVVVVVEAAVLFYPTNRLTDQRLNGQTVYRPNGGKFLPAKHLEAARDPIFRNPSTAYHECQAPQAGHFPMVSAILLRLVILPIIDSRSHADGSVCMHAGQVGCVAGLGLRQSIGRLAVLFSGRPGLGLAGIVVRARGSRVSVSTR